MTATLHAKDLRLTYGNAAVALSDVSIDVPQGGIVAVLGANGAGKTSLVRALTGQFGFYGGKLSGSIQFGDKTLSGLDPAAVARAGLVQVPEGRKLFAGLSVRENLLCGAAAQRGQKRAVLEERMDRIFKLFPKLKQMLGTSAGYLSGGEQQMVAIGRALMAEPKVLLCDELSLGLAPLVIAEIYATLAELNRDTALSLVVIEQNARQALKMATYAYVLEVGRIVAQGPAQELAQSAEVEQYYLGG